MAIKEITQVRKRQLKNEAEAEGKTIQRIIGGDDARVIMFTDGSWLHYYPTLDRNSIDSPMICCGYYVDEVFLYSYGLISRESYSAYLRSEEKRQKSYRLRQLKRLISEFPEEAKEYVGK